MVPFQQVCSAGMCVPPMVLSLSRPFHKGDWNLASSSPSFLLFLFMFGLVFARLDRARSQVTCPSDTTGSMPRWVSILSLPLTFSSSTFSCLLRLIPRIVTTTFAVTLRLKRRACFPIRNGVAVIIRGADRIFFLFRRESILAIPNSFSALALCAFDVLSFSFSLCCCFGL